MENSSQGNLNSSSVENNNNNNNIATLSNNNHSSELGSMSGTITILIFNSLIGNKETKVAIMVIRFYKIIEISIKLQNYFRHLPALCTNKNRIKFCITKLFLLLSLFLQEMLTFLTKI